MSKFSLDMMKRSVFKYFKTDDPDVILGGEFGEDVAMTRVGDDVLISHVDPIVGAVNNIGWLAVHVACNDIATSGAPPRWLQILVLVPNQDDELLLNQIMFDVARAAKETRTNIIGGHTGYSASLTRPLVAVTALATLGQRKPVLTSGAEVGDHVIITKGIPLEGTAILANDFSQAAISLGLRESDLTEAKNLMKQVSVIPEALILAEFGAHAMHDVTRGGLLEALLEMAALSNVGMRIDYEWVPIPDISQRFADVFQFDPLKMISSGTLVASLPPSRVNEAKNQLTKAGIRFADIGEIITGKGVKVLRDCELTHYDGVHPDEDELARLWVEYEPDGQ